MLFIDLLKYILFQLFTKFDKQLYQFSGYYSNSVWINYVYFKDGETQNRFWERMKMRQQSLYGYKFLYILQKFTRIKW